MDRLDEWRVFTLVAGLRSFIGAARALGRSPQAITRSVRSLEARLGTRLLHRTTRSVSLTGDGERHLARGRRVLAEIDLLEAPEPADAALRGPLALTAPVLFGQLHVAPVLAEFLAEHPALDVRLTLLDRVVALADEGIDVGVRIGALPDSALTARLVGHVRSVVCASPAYLRRHGVPRAPEDLREHLAIAFTGATPIPDRWSFPGPGRRERGVAVRPRLTVNTAQAAIDAALAGLGLTRVMSYQVAELVAARHLRLVLTAFEPPAVPVHLVHLPGLQARVATAFVGFAADRLRARLAALAG